MYVLWVMFMAYYIWWFFFLCLSAIMRSLKKKPMNPNLSILFVFSIFLCLFGSYAVGECRFKFVYFWWTDVYFKEISICISSNFSKSEDYSFFYFGNFHFVLVSVWVLMLSRVRLFVTPWTVAHQAPLSVGFSRQEHWSGWSLSSPGDLSDSGIKPRSPALQADCWLAEPPGSVYFFWLVS